MTFPAKLVLALEILLPSTRRLRWYARWSLAVVLAALPVHTLMFAFTDTQFVLLLGAGLLGVFALLALGLAVVGDFLRLLLHRRITFASAAPTWTTAMAVLVPVAWFATLGTHVDARLWLWWNESAMLQVVQGSARAGGGFQVLTLGSPAATLFFVRNGWDRSGIAYDPDHILGKQRFEGMRPMLVADLRGPWRLWREFD